MLRKYHGLGDGSEMMKSTTFTIQIPKLDTIGSDAVQIKNQEKEPTTKRVRFDGIAGAKELRRLAVARQDEYF